MNPVTGPYSTYVNRRTDMGGNVLSVKTSTSYRQKRPYNQPLPYYFRDRYTVKDSELAHLQADNSSGGVDGTKAFDVDTGGSSWGQDFLTSILATLGNRLRAKLSDKISDPSSMLTALVEGQSTISMVEKRLVQMLTFTKRWRERQFKQAILGILDAQKFKSPKKERLRRKRIKALAGKPRAYWGSKDLASGWIETWFGWLPTIGDVQKSVQNLSRDLPMEYVRVKSAIPYEVKNSVDYAVSSKHSGWVFGCCGCSVTVTNPNLYLASQLGLTNPVYTAFEVIPYSWLLAWFGNLSQFFQQFSEFHGVTVENAWKTYGVRDRCEFTFGAPAPGYPMPSQSGDQYCTSFRRSLGLPEITLQWRGLSRLSVTRGATLASLLALRLPRR